MIGISSSRQKFKRKDQAPLCACGCKEKVNWNKDRKRWNKFIVHHHSKGKNNPLYGRNQSGINNPMYGKRGMNCPNSKKLNSKMYTKTGILIKTINGWKSEHRIIAEKILNRELASKEVVHHIDKNPLNNNNSNLLICTHGYHCGLHNKMRENWKHSKETRQKMAINATGRKMLILKSGKRIWG